jgi:predicted O-methyltransferase YrrM
MTEMNPEQRGATLDAQRTLPENDYVSPGLAVVTPDDAFPNMMIGDTSVPRWIWLRRWVEQNWYTDRRNPDAGFASRDEASILYNSAMLFRGKPCLEVGCWRGWSAVHLALGAGAIDIIDPVFGDPGFAESIRASCEAAGVLDRVTFHEGFSPAAIDTLSQSTNTRWSFIFIDADHEGDAPRLDAEAAIRNAADTAMVMFHDLSSPYVAAGLDAMRDAGWRTMVYQTMQIMGVAWRGNVEPVQHIPDPKVFWTLPRHLSGYEVSGWKRPSLSPDGAWWPGMTMEDRRNAAMMRAQEAEDERTVAMLERDRLALNLKQVEEQIAALRAEYQRVSAEAGRLLDQHADAERQIAAAQGQIAEAQSRMVSLHTEYTLVLERAGAADARADEALRRAHAAEVSVAELAATGRRQAVRLQGYDILRDRLQTLGQTQENENAAILQLARWVAQKRVLFGLVRRAPADRVEMVRAQAAALGIESLITGSVAEWLCARRMLLGLMRRSSLFAEALVGCTLLQAAQAWRGHLMADMAQRLREGGV